VDADGRPVSSPIAEDGAFWIDGVQPGEYRAKVLWRGRECAFTLLPEGKGPVTDVGDQRCQFGLQPPPLPPAPPAPTRPAPATTMPR